MTSVEGSVCSTTGPGGTILQEDPKGLTNGHCDLENCALKPGETTQQPFLSEEDGAPRRVTWDAFFRRSRLEKVVFDTDWVSFEDLPIPRHVKTTPWENLSSVEGVYFAQSEHERGPVKIGRTFFHSGYRRFIALQIGNPHQITVRRFVRGDTVLEHTLHQHFAKLRIRGNGEWFLWSEELERVMTPEREYGRWQVASDLRDRRSARPDQEAQ